MKAKRKRRRNPPRSNPSMLTSTLVSAAAAIAGITIVAVAMQSRRNAAFTICSRIGTLLEAA